MTTVRMKRACVSICGASHLMYLSFCICGRQCIYNWMNRCRFIKFQNAISVHQQLKTRRAQPLLGQSSGNPTRATIAGHTRADCQIITNVLLQTIESNFLMWRSLRIVLLPVLNCSVALICKSNCSVPMSHCVGCEIDVL